ncbi:MAG: hypothetical protein P4L90_25840 [Rhodopila sp.]|nr:hypothetical protein [Rhodopila sp.]
MASDPEGAAGEPSPASLWTLSAALKEIDRLRVIEENAKAMRDVVASIADAPGKEQTMRAALRLLVRAFDEGTSDV